MFKGSNLVFGEDLTKFKFTSIYASTKSNIYVGPVKLEDLYCATTAYFYTLINFFAIMPQLGIV